MGESQSIAQVFEHAAHRLVFEGAPVGIWYFDAGGVISACNDAFARIVGAAEPLVGLDLTALASAELIAAVRASLGGERSRYEGVFHAASGAEPVWVRVELAPILDRDGAVLGGVGIAEDLTPQRATERARERSFQSLRALIESSPDGILVTTRGRFVLVNTKMLEIFGYERTDQLIGTALDDLVHPSDRAENRRRLEQSLADGRASPPRELRVLRRCGKAFTVEVSIRPIYFEGEPSILALAKDVTERKRLEARLAQSDRMASVGTLAAGVAHEVNNPLAYVMANLELIRRRVERLSAPPSEIEPVLEAVSQAADGCERVRVIARDLRVVSRAEAERRMPVDVNDVVAAAVNMARSQVTQRARLEVHHRAQVSTVLAYEASLGQVVINLLLNAAQAIPEGRADEHSVRVEIGEGDGQVWIAVSDDGEGIAPEHLDRIFEPFWTTKPFGVGTGLGLFICRNIVCKHGGQLRVDSTGGRGSRFTVTLPAHGAPVVAASTGAMARSLTRPST